ncbi:MAG: FAD-dependent oxidoreductase [Vicinamibacterales bacterium]
MQRDLRGLADATFDLVVVGAGIYGALAAWDAARRGLRVALVDRGDFGGATSANSMRTLHGGLRSLQSLNVVQMRRFIRERRAMASMAPHLVDPLPFCVPTAHHPTRNALALGVALAVTDAVGWDRNDGIADPALRLPRGRVVSRTECLRLNPLVDAAGVTGGAVWYDYQMRHAERLLLAAVRSAAGLGAVVANYVDARGLALAGGRVAALQARDVLTSETWDIRTRAVLNATGPWAAAVVRTLTGAPDGPAPRLSRAMNLVVARVTDHHACGGVVGGRMLLAVPWRDVTIVGTSHDPHAGGADEEYGTPDHVQALLRDVQLAFPRAGIGPGTIRLVHKGLLPMVAARGSSVALLKESAVVDHTGDGRPGLVSIFSVRYTTAGHTARQAIDVVCRQIGVGAPAPVTPLRAASAAFDTVDALVTEARRRPVPGATADLRERLARAYGSDWAEVASGAGVQPADLTPLSAACPVTRAEVLHAVRNECAVTLADVLLRRTDAGTAGHPGPDAVREAARAMAGELDWSPEREATERLDVDRRYPTP